MTLLIFALLAVLTALAIAYPLLPGRAAAPPATSVSDADVEREVRRLRQRLAGAQARGGLACPACGTAYQAGDRFCVRCGHNLGVEEGA